MNMNILVLLLKGVQMLPVHPNTPNKWPPQKTYKGQDDALGQQEL